MKLLKYGLPFAALAILASCSNDNAPEPGVQTPDVNDGSYYMTINLGLPSGTGSRAASLGGYDDGDPNEFAIDNAYIYFFEVTEGGDVNNATFTYSKQLDLVDWNKNEKFDDITLSKTLTVKLNEFNYPEGNDVYALLVLNQPTDNPLSMPTKPETGATGTTFEAWNTNNLVSGDFAGNGMMYTRGASGSATTTTFFTMMNAPTKEGTGVSTLVKIKKENLAKSPNPAPQAAGTFYVQRGVAKVVLGKTLLDGQKGVDFDAIPVNGNINTPADKVKVEYWALNVTNTKSYPVQNVSDYESWSGDHFFGNVGVAGTFDTNHNHIWWAVDPNYKGEAAEPGFNLFDATNLFASYRKATTGVFYCLENTMAAKQMGQGVTTQAVFECRYLLNGSDKGQTFVMYPGTDKACVVEGLLVANLPEADEKGMYAISDIIKDGYYDEENKLTNVDYVVQSLLAVNSSEKVYLYEGGKTYYVARIRHFNDDEAGLANGATSVSELDKYADEQLGRYGVLRNNVYSINIKSVLGYGTPWIPTPDPEDPDDPDDPELYNMYVDINILAWAKRGFDYDLK